MTATIYLIRHGTTRANREDRFAGRTDEPLHAEGLAFLALEGKKPLDRRFHALSMSR